MMTPAPTHRLMLMYDINTLHYGSYYRYILGEFVPMMQKFGMQMAFAWQVIGTSRPERQIDFVCEGTDVIRTLIHSDRFLRAERRLKSYTTRYERKVVRFEDRCQF